MLVHLLKHVHVSLNIGPQLFNFSLLSNDHLNPTLLGLQPLGKLFNLTVLLLYRIDLQVEFQAEAVEVLIVVVALLLQVPYLDVLVNLIRHQV